MKKATGFVINWVPFFSFFKSHWTSVILTEIWETPLPFLTFLKHLSFVNQLKSFMCDAKPKNQPKMQSKKNSQAMTEL